MYVHLEDQDPTLNLEVVKKDGDLESMLYENPTAVNSGTPSE
jgi:hypothetical protein